MHVMYSIYTNLLLSFEVSKISKKFNFRRKLSRLQEME